MSVIPPAAAETVVVIATVTTTSMTVAPVVTKAMEVASAAGGDLDGKRESMSVAEFLTKGKSFGGICITGDQGDNKLTCGKSSGHPYFSV